MFTDNESPPAGPIFAVYLHFDETCKSLSRVKIPLNAFSVGGEGTVFPLGKIIAEIIRASDSAATSALNTAASRQD